ncbi:N-acetylglucosamine kinase [Nonomuraea sp. NPDC050556]|uniref:N-acetylglucosamine kinase n=1 Tax=Nonomuraea sp. NPDC050556 TaxID=3364369 RepID=UPI0037B0A6FF
MTLALGLDVGGSTTRAVVVSASGSVLGSARGPGANPVVYGEAAVSTIAAAVRQAVADLRVEASVMGIAGGLGGFDGDFARMWASLGVPPPRLVSDVELAFVSGTASRTGSVLLAGTGAAASHVVDRVAVATADGHGWLLGDLGSGVWLGREAVRHLLTTIDQASSGGLLAARVLEGLFGEPRPMTRETASEAIHRVHAAPVPTLASLAPLVLAAAEHDPHAADILDRAAAHLQETLATVRPKDDDSPIVLAGGLLAQGSPLAARLPYPTITHAGDAARAAAWLALHDLSLDTPHPREVRT